MVIHADGGDEPGLIDVDFADFYGRGYRRCCALAYVLTGSAADADDLVQEAFATAYRRWSEIATYEDPLAWVRKVMVNNVMSRGRRVAPRGAGYGAVRKSTAHRSAGDR